MSRRGLQYLTIETDWLCVELEHDGSALTGVALRTPGEAGPRTDGDVPGWLAALAEDIRAHLRGEPCDFTSVPVDLSWTGEFGRRVYAALRQVPAGETVTYGELAVRVGQPGGARAVARAMATNRHPLIIPCHRVVGANGRLTGFSGAAGLTTKAQLLHLEGCSANYSAGEPLAASVYEPYIWDIAVAFLRRRDPAMGRLLAALDGARPAPGFPDNPFASLAQAVVYQQLAGSAAAAIFRRLVEALGGEPTPARVTAAGLAGLRSAGLSRSKAETLLALAEAVEAGLDLAALGHRPYDEVLARLTGIRGIGPWTVEMFAIFHLGLPDIFSPGDLGLRKAITRLQGRTKLVSPEQAARHARRWRPFSTVATWTLWRSLGTVTIT